MHMTALPIDVYKRQALKEVVKGIHPEEGLMLVRPLPGLLEG